jgi:hypothetical protein
MVKIDHVFNSSETYRIKHTHISKYTDNNLLGYMTVYPKTHSNIRENTKSRMVIFVYSVRQLKVLYRDGGTYWGNNGLRHLVVHSIYLFPTLPSVLHSFYYNHTQELSNSRRLSFLEACESLYVFPPWRLANLTDFSLKLITWLFTHGWRNNTPLLWKPLLCSYIA